MRGQATADAREHPAVGLAVELARLARNRSHVPDTHMFRPGTHPGPPAPRWRAGQGHPRCRRNGDPGRLEAMEQPARQPKQPDTVSTPVSTLPLQRSAENRVVGGVCGGLAEYTDIDPIIYRVLAAVLTLVGGAGLILYGAAMLLIPDARTG